MDYTEIFKTLSMYGPDGTYNPELADLVERRCRPIQEFDYTIISDYVLVNLNIYKRSDVVKVLHQLQKTNPELFL